MELLEEKSSSSTCVFALSLHPERNPFQLQYEMYINSPIHDFNGWLTAAHHQKVPSSGSTALKLRLWQDALSKLVFCSQLSGQVSTLLYRQDGISSFLHCQDEIQQY
ncbi:hypothetical protein CY34DRAFT_799187 [Suillus luteus UH-Slu-Lm8-n1]|uniref:Uncharacterized protein n=1 Tax=Suillus luteus UH-Slu-Lm8-n1 TaxID=930992 RepID=A0A0D0AB43_9AGAM|nr:hypothetical protein CY34DRAFT_799187 [Suillus luteus UH-Slu-Lm8-n1]